MTTIYDACNYRPKCGCVSVAQVLRSRPEWGVRKA